MACGSAPCGVGPSPLARAHQFPGIRTPIGTPARTQPRRPPLEDRVFHHGFDHPASFVIVAVSLPPKSIPQGAGHGGNQRFDLNVCDLRPIPALAESGPQTPPSEGFRAFLGKILGKVGRPLLGHPHDMDAAPARAHGELAARVDVNSLVGQQMHVQAVFLVQLEDTQAAGFRPLAPDQGQEVIPPLAGVNQVEDFRKGEGPEIEPTLCSETVTG